MSITKIQHMRVKPPLSSHREFANRASRTGSGAIPRGLENPQCYISCEKSNLNSHMEVGMQVWLYPEKKQATLGARRLVVAWDVVRPGADPDDEDGDPNEQFVTRRKAFAVTEREAARTFARELVEGGKAYFGQAEITEEVVDWFVEEDRVVEWVEVGRAEVVP